MSSPYFRQAGTSSFSIALVIGLYIACGINQHSHFLGGPGKPLLSQT